MTTFYQGLLVSYQDHTGWVNFIDDAYITICIREFEERSRNVNILVDRKSWNQIHLLKESNK
jgi:hypothetical protein